MNRKAVKTSLLTLMLFGVVWAFADWMVLGINGQGEYELRYFGKAGPKCCLYKLGTHTPDVQTPSF